MSNPLPEEAGSIKTSPCGRRLRLRRFSIVSLLFTCLASIQAVAQDAGDWSFSFDIGNRWRFNESGNEDLYRSQVDLGEGPKLFAAEFLLSLPEGSNRFLDQLEMRMNNWGGEPYNTGRLRIRKHGIYELSFDYFNARYFNSAPSLDNPFLEAGGLLSQHRSDISQRLFRVGVSFWPERRLSPFVSYSRSSQQGPVATTLSADGDEFLIGSEVAASSDTVRGGVRLRRGDFSLILEQGLRLTRDASTFHAKGFQTGNSNRPLLGNDIFLDDFRAVSDFDTETPFSTGLILWKPWQSLHLRAKVAYSQASLNSLYEDSLSGNFFPFPPFPFFYGEGLRRTPGSAKKPSLAGDFSVAWEVASSLLVEERFSLQRLHVAGGAAITRSFSSIDPLLGPVADPFEASENAFALLAVERTVQEVRGTVQLNPRLSIWGGHRFERKEARLNQSFSWDRHSLILGAAFAIDPRNRVSVDFELGRTDQPPILRTGQADFRRLRLRGRFSPIPALQVSGNLSLFDNRDGLSGIDLDADNRLYSLQVQFTPAGSVSLVADYQRSRVDSDLLFLVPQDFTRQRSIFLERGDYGSAYLSLSFPRDGKLDLGYSFWDVVGSFPQSSHRPMVRFEIPLNSFVSAYSQWNSYDYQERTPLFPQQYQTQLLTTGLRIRFQKAR